MGYLAIRHRQAQVIKFDKDIELLVEKRAELIKFKDRDEISLRIKRALRIFKKSSSLHKKQLIQMMVPKLVIDEKSDELAVFLNPFIEKSFNSNELSLCDTKPIMTLNSKNSGQGNLGETEKTKTLPDFALSQSKKKVRVADDWRGAAPLLELFLIQPIVLDFMRLYVIPLFKNYFFIHQKYVVEGLSVRQIARQIDCSKMAILEALVGFGIAIREVHRNHGHPSQPRFGKKYQKNVLVDHKIEQSVIGVVSDLREKGLSLREIAQVLSDMKIATKCNKSAWHPEMVRRILNHIDSTDI